MLSPTQYRLNLYFVWTFNKDVACCHISASQLIRNLKNQMGWHTHHMRHYIALFLLKIAWILLASFHFVNVHPECIICSFLFNVSYTYMYLCNHITFLCAGLLKHYGKDHQDYEDCLSARSMLMETSRNVPSVLQRSVSVHSTIPQFPHN
jgi:hypothetical protein